MLQSDYWPSHNSDTITRIYLERHDPTKNLHRFYQMMVTPGIFGDGSLVREWGSL